MRRRKRVTIAVAVIVLVFFVGLAANYFGGSTNKRTPIPSPPPTSSSMLSTQ